MVEQFLSGKVAIVTGANTGIGKAIAEELAKRGAKVVVNYRSHPERTDEMISAIKAAGGEAMGAQADVTHLDQLQAVVDQAVSSYGRLDIMVNNAGLEPARPCSTPARGLRQGSRCEPQECLLWHPVRRQADDQTRRWRPHHQYLFGA